MKNKTYAAALAALMLSAIAALFAAGCRSDPHDTHIRTSVSAPR